MPPRFWHVHIHGETIGPLSTDTIEVMLRQNRLQFLDFIWGEGLTKWQRIADLDEFASLSPPYPGVPIPSRAAKESPAPETKESAPKEVPEPAPQPAPKKERVWPKIRRYVRVLAGTGRIETKDHGEFEVINVSEGGVFVRSDQPLPIGTDVKFTLELQGLEKRFEMTGIVIRHGRVNDASGYGIEFTRLNPAHRRALQGYVEQREATD